MNPIVKDAIATLYTLSDQSAIAAACRVTPPIVEELLIWLRQADYVQVTSYPEIVDASIDIYVLVQYWIDGNFFSEFRSEIQISRLAPVFYIEHSFSVQNRHPKPVAPALRGFGGDIYIGPQLELHEQAAQMLAGSGFTELYLGDMDYPVEMLLGTAAHTDNRLPTVRQALFEDLLDVLDDE